MIVHSPKPYVGRVKFSGISHRVIRPTVPRLAERFTPARNAWIDTAVTSSFIIGKGVMLFTMFYYSMNWWIYRKATQEKDDKKK
jgi:hypothetical protein